MTTYVVRPTLIPNSRLAKMKVFEGIWKLAMLNPRRFSLLFKCGKRDRRYGQGDFILIEAAHFVIDKNWYKSLHGQHDMAKNKIILEGNPYHEFVYCATRRAKEERAAFLIAHEKEIDKVDSKFPVDEFCCDMFSMATDFFIYDKTKNLLYYYGHYPPLVGGSNTDIVKRAMNKLNSLKGISHKTGEAKRLALESAYTALKNGLKTAGLNPEVVPTCKVGCRYEKPVVVGPTGELSGSAKIANAHAQLRDCLKYAANKLLKGENCDDESKDS